MIKKIVRYNLRNKTLLISINQNAFSSGLYFKEFKQGVFNFYTDRKLTIQKLYLNDTLKHLISYDRHASIREITNYEPIKLDSISFWSCEYDFDILNKKLFFYKVKNIFFYNKKGEKTKEFTFEELKKYKVKWIASERRKYLRSKRKEKLEDIREKKLDEKLEKEFIKEQAAKQSTKQFQ